MTDAEMADIEKWARRDKTEVITGDEVLALVTEVRRLKKEHGELWDEVQAALNHIDEADYVGTGDILTAVKTVIGGQADIRKAVLAEREACATLADEHHCPEQWCGETIGEAIRSRKT